MFNIMFNSHITNADRAEWAREGLSAFEPLVYFGDPDEVEHITTRIKDLITNLLHLARREWDTEEGEEGEFDATAFATSAALMHDIEAAEDPEE